MGQAKLRGTQEERIAAAQRAYQAMTLKERKKEDWQRLPWSVRRRQLRAEALSAASRMVGELLTGKKIPD